MVTRRVAQPLELACRMIRGASQPHGGEHLISRTIHVTAARQPPLNVLKESLIDVPWPCRCRNARAQRQRGALQSCRNYGSRSTPIPLCPPWGRKAESFSYTVKSPAYEFGPSKRRISSLI